MLLRLAWRNIWRNRRRTYITGASILFAVLFASFMESLQRGAWNNMIDSVVSYYFGYVQVHEQGYWVEQSIDKAFPLEDSLLAIAGGEGVQAVLPRLESFALAAAEESTVGVLVVGIAPETEDRMTDLENRLVAGTYLGEREEAVLLAEGVAERLNLSVGDTLVLISQGFRGVNAAGKYPIRGLVHFGSPELNKQMVYLSLPAAQAFYGAEGRVTSLALMLDDKRYMQPVQAQLRAQLDSSAYEVMDWEEMLPDLVQARELDSAGNVIVYFILYLIIAFGVFGTILMMAKERAYEFGLLVAIGMQRWRLALSVWLEILLLGLLGALAGILASIPLVYYFKINPIRFSGEMASSMEKFGFEPIFPATLELNIFLLQAGYVLAMTALLGLYLVWEIARLAPVQAMRA